MFCCRNTVQRVPISCLTPQFKLSEVQMRAIYDAIENSSHAKLTFMHMGVLMLASRKKKKIVIECAPKNCLAYSSNLTFSEDSRKNGDAQIPPATSVPLRQSQKPLRRWPGMESLNDAIPFRDVRFDENSPDMSSKEDRFYTSLVRSSSPTEPDENSIDEV